MSPKPCEEKAPGGQLKAPFPLPPRWAPRAASGGGRGTPTGCPSLTRPARPLPGPLLATRPRCHGGCRAEAGRRRLARARSASRAGTHLGCSTSCTGRLLGASPAMAAPPRRPLLEAGGGSGGLAVTGRAGSGLPGGGAAGTASSSSSSSSPARLRLRPRSRRWSQPRRAAAGPVPQGVGAPQPSRRWGRSAPGARRSAGGWKAVTPRAEGDQLLRCCRNLAGNKERLKTAPGAVRGVEARAAPAWCTGAARS